MMLCNNVTAVKISDRTKINQTKMNYQFIVARQKIQLVCNKYTSYTKKIIHCLSEIQFNWCPVLLMTKSGNPMLVRNTKVTSCFIKALHKVLCLMCSPCYRKDALKHQYKLYIME